MHAYGVDIGGTSIKAGMCEGGRVVRRESSPSPRDPAQMAAAVVALLTKLGWREGEAPVGVDCAGSVTPDGRVLADNLGWQAGVPLGKFLLAAGCTATVLNDASAALIAEWKVGALRGAKNRLLLTFGTGIGSAAILNGAPYEGRDGRGLEMGHIITHARGPACSCGQQGCWELYASAGALSRFCGGIAPRQAMERAKRGELRDGFGLYMEEVALGLVSCLSAFVPEVVAFGGGLSEAGDFFLQSVTDAARAVPGFQRLYGDVRFSLAETGNDAGVIGAALNALENA